MKLNIFFAIIHIFIRRYGSANRRRNFFHLCLILLHHGETSHHFHYLLLHHCCRRGSSDESHRFSKKISPISMGLNEKKLSHLHFYFHDIVSASESTAVRVAEAAMTNKSATVFMMDDLLTEGPEPNSKMVGKA